MDVILIKDLSHAFHNGAKALDGLNLTVPRGQLLVVAGPNGSGKTTMLRCLNGLLIPKQGTVSIMGRQVAENPALARRAVGMVFQDPDAQIVGETVRDDCAFGPENLKLAEEEITRRVDEALAVVGLSHMADKRPHVLSAGEKRRLAIAGVLAMGPEIIVFDEPFSNLDYPGVRQVLGQIVELHGQGRTIIITTHDLDKIAAHAERLVIMQRGRLVRDGRPEDLLPEVEDFGIRMPSATRLGLEVPSWLN